MKRRAFLITSAFGAGVMSIGVRPVDAMDTAGAATPIQWFGHFLRIDSTGVVTIVSPHMEMGQGAETGIALLVAEELDADWHRVRVESAPAAPARYGHATFKMQLTGGSSSISSSWDRMRRVGATARAMFVEAAAKLWGVPSDEISVQASVVQHKASGRSVGFGDLLELAAQQAVPEQPVLKPKEAYRLLGKESIGRLDAADIATGRQQYTIDVSERGMLTALVAHPPRAGGKLRSFDATDAKSVTGVVDVFAISTGVAVVAKGFFQAQKARGLLKINWDEDAAEHRSSQQIRDEHRDIARETIAANWSIFAEKGSFENARDDLVLDFSMPYIAHAAMEPMNCVAAVDGKQVHMRFGCQGQSADQINVAALLGCEQQDVHIDTLHAGGSFGRRSVARSDYQLECVEIARHVGGGIPVKLQWTREDDMAGGDYRGTVHHHVRVRQDEQGNPLAWKHRVVSASLVIGTIFGPKSTDGYVESHIVEGVQGSPYLDIPAVLDARVAYTRSPITVGWLRSVGNTHTAFVMEHTVDCLARSAGVDPVEYRRRLYALSKADRHLVVLERAAQRWGWGSRTLEPGHAVGIAVHECFGSTVATIAEVSGRDSSLRVHRVLVVVDCGFAINPSQVVAQAEGGVNYALSWAMFGEVKIEDGKVQNLNFHNYRVLRMNEAPEIDVDIIASDAAPTGVGEPVSPVVVPAVANALLALHGQPVSRLPFVSS